MSEAVAGQLAECLAEMRGLYEELLAVLRRKLEAMRRADTELLNSCAVRERFLLQRITESESSRKTLAADLQLRAGAKSKGPVSITELAERIGEPGRSKLLVLADGLRRLVEQTNQVNQVAALASKELLAHFRHVYDAMRAAERDTGTYDVQGVRTSGGAQRILDAVG